MAEKIRIKLALMKTTTVDYSEIKNKKFIEFWEALSGNPFKPGEKFVECSVYNFDPETLKEALECLNHWRYGENGYVELSVPKYIPTTMLRGVSECDKIMVFDEGYEYNIEVMFDQLHSKYAQLGSFIKLSVPYSA